ncbi:MAG: hypothetical protein FWF96_07125 [Kiritimatiellaeota bacterium]|nr:hypothetical protein [Kiritimatiellota bacterium]
MKIRLGWKIVLSVVLFVYLVAPFFAGALGLGRRPGPVLWLEGWHDFLYSMGYEGSFHIKPRIGPGDIFLRRPFFYGLPERPYPKEKRLQMIEERRERDPDRDDWALRQFEKHISELEAEGQYFVFDSRRRIFFGESK